MLCDEARTDLRRAAWRCRRRLHQHLDLTAVGHPEHAEAEAATEIAIARVGLTTLAAHRHLRGNPDLVAGRCTIDRLKDQLEIEGQLELADHDYRRIAGAEAHEIAAADLALDREAELFEEAFDRQIERGFQRKLPNVTSIGESVCGSLAPEWT